MIHTGAAVLAALGPEAAQAASNSGGSALGAALPIILLVGVFYLFIIRPQRNRQKQMLETRRNLEPGVEVLTSFGMYATVVSIEDDGVILEIAPGVHSRFSQQVVARVLTPESDEPVDSVEPDDVDPDVHSDSGAPEPPATTATGV